MLSDSELDRELRRLFAPPEPTVEEVLRRIVDHPLPPHLSALVEKVMRSKPGGALFKRGANARLAEVQGDLDKIVADVICDPATASVLWMLLTADELLCDLKLAAQRDDFPPSRKAEVAKQMAILMRITAPLREIVPRLTEFFAKAARGQQAATRLYDAAADELFALDVELTARGL
jgi:hypothetical protein